MSVASNGKASGSVTMRSELLDELFELFSAMGGVEGVRGAEYSCSGVGQFGFGLSVWCDSSSCRNSKSEREW